MRLRSGRCLAPPVAAPRGAARRVRPRRTPDGSDGVGEDRLSSLPLDLQLEVLARLHCARGAARTSVLSRPWRGLWTQLRELTFDGNVDPDSLAGTLSRLGELAQVRVSKTTCQAQLQSEEADSVPDERSLIEARPKRTTRPNVRIASPEWKH